MSASHPNSPIGPNGIGSNVCLVFYDQTAASKLTPADLGPRSVAELAALGNEGDKAFAVDQICIKVLKLAGNCDKRFLIPLLGSMPLLNIKPRTDGGFVGAINDWLAENGV
jgi:hypothetical protein